MVVGLEGGFLASWPKAVHLKNSCRDSLGTVRDPWIAPLGDSTTESRM